jgi:hemoglobin
MVLPGPPTDTQNPWGNAETPYIELGGEEPVRLLVEAFYDIIDAESPLIREMLPKNLSGTRQKLYEYLTGWLGGPPLYADKRGHPLMRRRHLPFSIGDDEAAEWIRCMTKAMDQRELSPQLNSFLTAKLTDLALHMRNQ